MKTSELKGLAFNWAVAIALGWKWKAGNSTIILARPNKNPKRKFTELGLDHFHPTTCWSIAGPIIERECIGLRGPSIRGNAWAAFIDLSGISQGPQHRHTGPTPLIAAMRCFVASKLGDEIELPKELT
jgi:hypothetical protein